MTSSTLQITHGRVIDPHSGLDALADVFIEDGRIAAIGQKPGGFVPTQTLDAAGCIVCPGLVDLSVRLGAVELELSAAVAGGVTSLACPPDSRPPLDEPGLVERLVRRSEAVGLAHVYPLGALTVQLAGERLAEMHSLKNAGCIAFSQAQQPIVDTQVLLRAMQYAATFDLAVHLTVQDYHLSRDGVAHDGEIAARLGLSGIPICAETIAVATALHLAQATGARLHLARLSSAAALEQVRSARQHGQAVTCDIGCHHLHLCEADIGYFDSHTRFTPPLRSASDREALRQAAAEGLAVLCSDHSPLSEDGKQIPFAEAQPGATGVELLLPLTLRWAQEAGIPLTAALARITSEPAAILGIPAGTLAIGAAADLCIFNPDETWRVTPETLRSQGKNTPFPDAVMHGRVRQTLVGGRPVFLSTEH